ncbi:hypothetical protein B0H10DRAFT_2213697 [Mycena sp. CBHHK59/15]|nr:hypothetical protein B0H10DRAFT_2213697 [Mycena sp. CBHHK59/15]
MSFTPLMRMLPTCKTGTPRYPLFYDGLLFGAGCTKPLIVKVPVNVGITSVAHHVDDLDIDELIDEYLGGIVDMGRYFSRVPGPGWGTFVSRRQAYVIAKHPGDGITDLPTNILLHNMGVKVNGTILVLGLGENDVVEDVSSAEIPIVAALLKCAIIAGVLTL